MELVCFQFLVLTVYSSNILAADRYKTVKDFPEECFTAMEIDDATRAFDNFNVPTSRASDLDLKKGWYRIMGKAGNSLKQGYTKFNSPAGGLPNFCATQLAGTLLGEHPTEEEGVVEMTVCFRERFCFEKLVNECECTEENTITIYVRNCRNHYIYWLTPTHNNQRYCTGKTSLTGPKVTNNGSSLAVECKEHKLMKLNTRVWDELSDVKCDEKEKGWYRYSDVAGLEMASTCNVYDKDHVVRLSQPCGATFRGWMVEPHPKLEDGRVQRRVCFTYADQCSCQFYANVAVRNCGSFYVYRLSGVPICNARFCGAVKGSLAAVNDATKEPAHKSTDICDTNKVNYQVMHDPDRLWSYTSPSINKCDALLYGRYRFGSKYTPWSIKEGCNKSDMIVVTHRCGAKYQGFMEGKHPLKKDGYVERVICFQQADLPCECKHTAIVGVQNCGNHYVYDFKGVPICDLRFCMVANGTSAIKIDLGKAPQFEIPAPGYTPVVAKNSKDKDDSGGGLVATTTVLSIIVLIVLIFFIIIVLLLTFIVWPRYIKEKKGRPKSRRSDSVHITEENHPIEPKQCGSNGDLPHDSESEEFEETPIAPYPSVPPHTVDPLQSSAPISQPESEDSEIEMCKGPGSDDDLNTIPEDTEFSDNECDLFVKKDSVNKPTQYNHKDSEI